jgi:hypothetical protein
MKAVVFTLYSTCRVLPCSVCGVGCQWVVAAALGWSDEMKDLIKKNNAKKSKSHIRFHRLPVPIFFALAVSKCEQTYLCQLKNLLAHGVPCTVKCWSMLELLVLLLYSSLRLPEQLSSLRT